MREAQIYITKHYKNRKKYKLSGGGVVSHWGGGIYPPHYHYRLHDHYRLFLTSQGTVVFDCKKVSFF